MSDLLDALSTAFRGLAALVAGLLPRRRWGDVSELPIERLALVSGLCTLAAGLALGLRGFMAYAQRAADAAAEGALEAAARQVQSGGAVSAEITTLAPQALSALSIFAFALFTPLGWLSLYLAASGLTRVASTLADQPLGDPLLTGLDELLTRTSRRVQAARTRRARERLEGPEVPDELLTGASVGLSAADLVVVASRRKPGWTAGLCIVTSERRYTLQDPVEVLWPQGLRTLYPLTEQRVVEVLRRFVRYDLPSRRPSTTAPSSSPRR